jgi:hypothetical protein
MIQAGQKVAAQRTSAFGTPSAQQSSNDDASRGAEQFSPHLPRDFAWSEEEEIKIK